MLAVAALWLAGQSAVAQTASVAVTAVDVPAQTDTAVAVPQVNQVVGEFDVTSATADTVTIGGAGFATGQFPLNSQGNPLYYVRFLAGPLAGQWFNVDAQNGETLTLSLEDTGDAPAVDLSTIPFDDFSGDLLILRHWTVAELFPDSLEGATFAASPNPFQITFSIFLPRDSDGPGTNVATPTRLFYNGQSGQWQTTAGVPADDFVVLPQGAMTLRNDLPISTGEADEPGTLVDESTGSLVFYGQGAFLDVPTIENVPIAGVENDVVLGAGNLFPVTLAASGLDDVIAASPNPFQITDSVFLAPLSNAGDGFNLASADRFIRVNDAFLTTAGSPADDVVIEPGQVITIRNDAGTPDTTEPWTVR